MRIHPRGNFFSQQGSQGLCRPAGKLHKSDASPGEMRKLRCGYDLIAPRAAFSQTLLRHDGQQRQSSQRFPLPHLRAAAAEDAGGTVNTEGDEVLLKSCIDVCVCTLLAIAISLSITTEA